MDDGRGYGLCVDFCDINVDFCDINVNLCDIYVYFCRIFIYVLWRVRYGRQCRKNHKKKQVTQLCRLPWQSAKLGFMLQIFPALPTAMQGQSAKPFADCLLYAGYGLSKFQKKKNFFADCHLSAGGKDL